MPTVQEEVCITLHYVISLRLYIVIETPSGLLL